MSEPILISNYITDDNGNRAKALLNTFKKGVSNKLVKVTISDTDPVKSDKDGKEDADKDNKEDSNKDNKENKDSTKPSEVDSKESNAENSVGKDQSSKDAGKTSNNNDASLDSGKKESFSIMESYLKLMPIFEEDSPKPSDQKNKSDKTSSSKDSKETSDKSKDDKNDDNKEDKDSTNKEFEISRTIYVTVLLKNQGYTVWHIGLGKNVDIEDVKEAINNKTFGLAYTKAGGQLKPLSAATYIYSKIITPFIGRCRYAIDSGSEEAESDSNTIAIAVAPINGVTNKPSENTVYKTVYNIRGDISGGGMDFLNKLKDNDYISQEDLPDSNDEEDSKYSSRDDSNSVSGVVSKWLHKKFKCVGDSSMYGNFLKLLKFVSEQVSAGNLEYNKDESDTVTNYSKEPNVKKSLITY